MYTLLGFLTGTARGLLALQSAALLYAPLRHGAAAGEVVSFLPWLALGLAGLAGSVFFDRLRALAIAGATPALLFFPFGTAYGAAMIGVLALSRVRELFPAALRKRKARRASSPLVLLALPLLPMMVGTLWVFGSIRERGGGFSPGVIALIAPVLLVGTLIHEGGHFWFGQWQKLRPCVFAVGPLTWLRLARGRWEFHWLPRVRGFAGGCVSSQPLVREGLSRRLAWMIVGGPLAHAAAGGVALGLFLWVDPARHMWWSYGLGFAVLSWLFAGPMNLVPLRISGSQTDGDHLWQLWRGGEARAAEERAWLTEMPFATRARFADSGAGGCDALTGGLARYYQALEAGDFAAAGRQLEAAREAQARWPVRARDRQLAYEAAWFAAAHGGRAAAVEGPFHGHPVDAFLALRVEVAVAERAGRWREAEEARRAALAELEACAETGWTALNRALLAPAGGELQRLEEALAAEAGVAWQQTTV